MGHKAVSSPTASLWLSYHLFMRGIWKGSLPCLNVVMRQGVLVPDKRYLHRHPRSTLQHGCSSIFSHPPAFQAHKRDCQQIIPTNHFLCTRIARGNRFVYGSLYVHTAQGTFLQYCGQWHAWFCSHCKCYFSFSVIVNLFTLTLAAYRNMAWRVGPGFGIYTMCISV